MEHYLSGVLSGFVIWWEDSDQKREFYSKKCEENCEVVQLSGVTWYEMRPYRIPFLDGN
jgi:hypothetical protein